MALAGAVAVTILAVGLVSNTSWSASPASDDRWPAAKGAAGGVPGDGGAERDGGAEGDGGAEVVLSEADYWAAVTRFGPYSYRYDSVDEMAADSHLIVRGHVVGSSIGKYEVFGEGLPVDWIPTAFAVVSVDEVLKGSPESKSPGTILVADLGVPDIKASSLPKDEVILFLKSISQWRQDMGEHAADDPDDRYFYVRPNGYQCMLRNADGKVSIAPGPTGWENAFGSFPSELHGKSYQEVLSDVRLVAAGAA